MKFYYFGIAERELNLTLLTFVPFLGKVLVWFWDWVFELFGEVVK